MFPELLESRAETGERLLRITDDLTLTLSRSAVFGENFVVRKFQEDGTMEERQMKAADFEQHLYHDEDKMASVTVKEQGGLQVTGVLGTRLRIRPMPEGERSESGHVAHWLYEANEGVPMHRDSLAPKHDVKVTERAADWEVPGTIYPEVYVISDFTHSMFFKGIVEKIVEYLGTVFNAVNLRYTTVSNPRVSLRIMGLSINSENEDKKYVFRNPSNPVKQIWGVETLYNLTYYVQKEPMYSDYDLVLLVTGLDLMGYASEGRPSHYRGFAFEGAICGAYKTGITEDAGVFTDIEVFAHEIGHSLGCPHDGDSSVSELAQIGAPGSTRCPYWSEYIMGYIYGNRFNYTFSPCCNDMITFVAHLRRCLSEKNVNKERIQSQMFPGQVMNITQQCRQAFPEVRETYAMSEYAMGICRVKCYMPKRVLGWEAYTVTRVLDGTECGYDDTQVCYDGICRKKLRFKRQ